MSGLTTNTGLVGTYYDLFQRFTADGTWRKPYGVKTVVIE